jgi:RNA polymerase sigma-70 factor (ECF subfamily)
MPDNSGGRGRLPQLEQELAELLSKIARGCESALGRLYDKTISQVYGLAAKILLSHDEADEVSLDVFNQVWQRSTEYSPDRGSPSAWLITLTRSRAIDKLRSGKKRKFLRDPLPDDVPDHSGPPDEETETRQKRELIESALSELPASQRRSIELAYFHGMSQTEISVHMNEPLGTVKSWMRAGMARLRQRLCEG